MARTAVIIALMLASLPASARSLESEAIGCAELRDIENYSRIVRATGKGAGATFIDEVIRTNRCTSLPAGTTIIELETFFSQDAFNAVTKIRLREGAPPIWVLSATIALNHSASRSRCNREAF